MISLIVAKADNDVIGRNNQMPWHLPADLKHFKARTLGKPIVMGRKTFDSLGRVLPGRPHVVISRTQLTLPDNCHLAHSLQDALTKARALTTDSSNEVVVIGGAEIYRLALPLVDTLYVTEVHLSPEGDAFFPALDQSQWQETERQDVPAGADSAIAYSIVTYQHKRS
ncbi:MAG TPA: dihydrofolate reductase [Dongiaceae bacterium]|nr:dihydrofolate reductase [Dongiaceae bacterium]